MENFGQGQLPNCLTNENVRRDAIRMSKVNMFNAEKFAPNALAATRTNENLHKRSEFRTYL